MNRNLENSEAQLTVVVKVTSSKYPHFSVYFASALEMIDTQGSLRA